MRVVIGTGGIVIAAGLLALGQLKAAGDSAPTARYEMDVATTSGMTPGARGAIGMMLGRGGGGAPRHELTLRLGSSLAPSGGAPHADHFLPPAAGLGASVPLVTPVDAPATPTSPGTESAPEGFQRPKGRLLLFWGCGAHVGPGQPVIIDFGKLAEGQMPPHLFSVSVPRDPGPTRTTSRTFGEWPNATTRKTLGANASLLGDHRIAGNYSPDIAFTLDQDVMPPLQAQHQSAPDGSQLLSWGPVTAATGYYAWLIGVNAAGGSNPDMVWWTSAGRQEFGGGLSDWLAPAVVSRLIGEKVVLPPTQTSCTIPAEVKGAAGGFMMTQLAAYGPERSFAYPPRPANPRTPWKPDWTARVRFRSSTTVMMGMPGMAGETGADAGDGAPAGDAPKKKCKPSVFGVLRGNIC